MTPAVGLLFSTALALADSGVGATAFDLCTLCHGASGEGNRATGAPALAGQEAWYVARQLESFRDGRRGADPSLDPHGARMAAYARGLDDLTIATLAEYVASLPRPDTPRTLQADAASGARHFETCATCHGERAAGRRDTDAPALFFQHDWYLVRQLENFRQGARGAHAADVYGARMGAVAGSLDEAAVHDVIAYVATLRGASAP